MIRTNIRIFICVFFSVGIVAILAESIYDYGDCLYKANNRCDVCQANAGRTADSLIAQSGITFLQCQLAKSSAYATCSSDASDACRNADGTVDTQCYVGYIADNCAKISSSTECQDDDRQRVLDANNGRTAQWIACNNQLSIEGQACLQYYGN